MSTELPDAVQRAFDANEAFEPAETGYTITTTTFENQVTAAETDGWRVYYEVRVWTPILGAAVDGEVGVAVENGWLDTFERRLEDAPMTTRVAVELEDFSVRLDSEDVVVTYGYTLGDAGQAATVAKAFVEYVEGTYVEGTIPGYEYTGQVAELLNTARTDGDEESQSSTPL